MNDFTYGIKAYLHANRSYPKDVLRSIWQMLKAIVRVPWVIVSIVVSPLLSLLARLTKRHAPGLWRRLTRPTWIRNFFSRSTIDVFGNVIPPRPHAFSMRKPYPHWTGMVIRKWSGRHLPPPPDSKLARPGLDELEQLFLRPAATGAQINDVRSNLLFASFAQWFTDSFLRTSHKLRYDKAGNTQIMPDGTLHRGRLEVQQNGQTGYMPDHHRERENESNHEIDLCQIYGTNARQTQILRYLPTDSGYDASLHKGTLKSEIINGEEFPAKLLLDAPDVPKNARDEEPRTPLSFDPKFADLYEDEPLLRTIFSSAIHNTGGYTSLFACGLEHGNSTLGNSLFNILFLRHHNLVARDIAKGNPEFDDDEVFEKARNVMIVLLLQIVISDYVRHISPLDLPFKVPPKFSKGQDWYRTNRIHFEFNLLYRWHSLIPDMFPFLGHQDAPLRNFASFRHNNAWLIDRGLKSALYEFIETPAGKMTLGNTPQALRFVKRDTLKLMRAANLAGYNDYRERFGLHRVKSFEEVTGEKVVAAALRDLYDDKIDDLEFYIGLVAERHIPDGIMGPLMFTMVAHDALTHALTNPLLAEEMHVKLRKDMEPGEHVFTRQGLKYIREVETLHALASNVIPGLDKDRPITFRKPQGPTNQ